MLTKRLHFAYLAVLILASTNSLFGLAVGDRIKAAAGGASVRDDQLADPPLFSQQGGVHGTITGGPMQGTAGGFTGNWWRIHWDSQPPDQGSTQGWCAESVITPASFAGDLPQPDFAFSYYTTANRFWQEGFAPISTSPPTPQLGSALGNCTWYAHGRLRQLGYNLAQLNVLLGNASDWDSVASNNGILVDATPTVGSIAQTDSGAGGLGHVAVVENVHGDGSITVTESSYSESTSSPWNFLWRHRTVSKTWFQNFIHVSSIPSGITQVNLNGALVSADAGGIVRVRGARILSDSTDLDDYVVLQYRLQIPGLDLQPLSATVYPDIGVVYRPEAIFVKNVAAEFTLTRNTQTFQSSTTYTITAANDQPFHMNLEAGTTLCFHLNNPSRNYHFIIQKADSGEIIRDSYHLTESNWAAWQTAILASGEYLVFFQAENATSMTLEMTAFNSNRFPLSDLAHGSSFSASFREGSGDYRKWRIFLQRGQTLTVTKTSESGDISSYVIFEDSTSWGPAGFATFAYVAKQTGNYYLVFMTGALSGSCAGTISISGPAMTFAAWRNLYGFAAGMEYPNRDPDGDGLPNFAEYALDTDPLAPTSSREFQSLSIEGGNAAFSITTPKYAVGATYRLLSGDEIRNLNNRSVQIFPNPADPAKQDLKVIDPVASRQFYQLRVTNAQP